MRKLTEKEYKNKISIEFNITMEGVASAKKRFGFKTYKRTYKKAIFMKKIVDILAEIFILDARARDIKELYPHSNNPNAAACSFVNYLYRTKDKGLVSKGQYNKCKEVYKYLKNKKCMI